MLLSGVYTREFGLLASLCDLFTKNCSGFAGESFIQTVQSVMPRLLTAVAPAGAAGRENRRQCLKVTVN